MGMVSATIDDDLEEEFREAISRRYIGYRKGNAKKALTEAIREWTLKVGSKREL